MSDQVKKIRKPLWPEWLRGGWGAALLLLGIYSLTYTGFSLFTFGGGELGTNLANITYLPVGLVSTIFAWRLAFNRGCERRLRLAWLFLGFGIFLHFLGDFSWLYLESILGIEPYPSIANVFYLLTYPFMLWGMLTFPMNATRIKEKLRFSLDALIGITAGSMVMWNFLILPAMQAAEGDLVSAVVGASYPISDLILWAGLIVLFYNQADSRIRGSLRFLSAGITLFLAADIIYAFTVDTYVSGMWLDSLWLGAYFMFALTAVYQAKSRDTRTVQSWAQQVESAMQAVITVVSFISFLWIIYTLASREMDEVTKILLLSGGLLLATLLISRQWLTVRENQKLLEQSRADQASLEGFSRSLEQRVNESTSELLLAADVVRQVSVVRDIDQLLQDTVNTIAERFGLYYVQVYLLDSKTDSLVLKTGSGEAGQILRQRGHQLGLNSSSINATAVVEKGSILVADTSQSEMFRPNPLLPETRCELAVPLIYQGNVLGVLDMQSSQPGGLSQEKIPVFVALAGQLAISIENANLHETTQQAMRRAEEQAALLTRAGWREFMDGIIRSENFGFTYIGGRIEAIEAVPQADPSLESIRIPVDTSGETIGWLQLEGLQVNTPRNQSLARWAASQVAEKMERLRLLAQAERYRMEAEQVAQRLTRESWQSFKESWQDGELGFVYNQQIVSPLASGINGYHEHARLQPLQVRGEPIGEMGVVCEPDLDAEDVELVETIAQQLSTHLENLRLLEETRQAEAELASRAADLAKVAELATQVTSQTEVQHILQSLVDQVKDSFDLYHAHIYLLDEEKERLDLAAGAGEIGRKMVASGWQIPVASVKSLVARAARDRKSVIVNDVRADPEFLPNQMLPETRSEMAVPLVVGSQVSGVLDVQSDEVNHFTMEDASIQATLASQVAIALQNAQLFQKTQQQAKREAAINTISQRIQATSSIEEAMQVAVRELGRTLGAQRATIQLGVQQAEPEKMHPNGGSRSTGGNGSGKNGH